jgi:hypothetical protein
MAVELGGALGELALFAVPGTALTELVPAVRAMGWPRRLAYGYLLGVAAIAGTLYALSHTLAVPLRAPAIWTTAGVFLATGLIAHRRSPLRRRRERPPQDRWTRALGWAAVLIGGFVCLGVAADAVTDPVKDWDGRMTWCAQARYIRAAGSVDAPVLTDDQWFITHPQYPLLLPVAQVAAQEAYGATEDSHAFRILYAAFLPVLMLLLHDGARRFAGETAGALAVILVAVLPIASELEGSAATTYSDLPLACFYGGGLLLLLCRRGRLASAAAAGVLLGAALLSKNEGLPLAIAALVIGALAPGRARRGPARQRRRRRLLLACLPPLLALALLLAWRAGIPNRQDESYPALLAALDWRQALFHQPGLFLPVIGSGLVSWERWRGFWFLAPVLLALGWRCWRRPLTKRLAAAAVIPVAIAWVAYAVHWDPASLARVTWDRILLQAAVPLFLLLAGACAALLRTPGRAGDGASPPAGGPPELSAGAGA